MSTLKGPGNWAIWVILVPQLVAAAVGIAGLSAVVGSAFSVVLPGPTVVYAELILLGCVALTTTGQFAYEALGSLPPDCRQVNPSEEKALDGRVGGQNFLECVLRVLVGSSQDLF